MDDSVQKIGVIGLGLLGRGIVACLLAHRKHVIAFSNVAEDFDKARQHIPAAIGELVERAEFSPALLKTWSGGYQQASSIHDLAECDLVIESVTENRELKQGVLNELEAVVGSDVPIATNSSGFSLSELQESMKHPERLVAMHWATPAHATRFIELARGPQTTDAAFAAVVSLAQSLGKDPCVLDKEIEGLIVNRLAYAMYREAFHLLELGVADVETIDRAFRNGFGLWAAVAGPFRWMDLTGLPAYGQVMERLWPTLSNATEVPARMLELIAGGARGISTRGGFYNYTDTDAAKWESILRENAWRVRELQSSLP